MAVNSGVYEADGSYRVTVVGGSSGGSSGGLTDTELRASAVPVSLATVPSHAVTNAGTFATQATQAGTWNVGTVATVTNVVHVDDNSSTLTVDAPVGTPVFVRLSDGSSAISTLPVSLASAPSTAVTNAGTFAVQAAQSGTWTVQPGNTANTTAWKVDGSAVTQPVSGTVTANLAPVTSGGLTISSTLIASGTNATSVKGSAGQLYKVEAFNNSTTIGYLKIYNSASAPTAGAGTPVIRLMIPASGGVASEHTNGVAFSSGIGFTFTGGIADADTTSVAATTFIVNLYYK